MLKIEIKSALVTEISGVSKAGRPYNIRKQPAWAHTYDAQGNPNPYPERIEMSLFLRGRLRQTRGRAPDS